jgi:hypothetical protein
MDRSRELWLWQVSLNQRCKSHPVEKNGWRVGSHSRIFPWLQRYLFWATSVYLSLNLISTWVKSANCVHNLCASGPRQPVSSMAKKVAITCHTPFPPPPAGDSPELASTQHYRTRGRQLTKPSNGSGKIEGLHAKGSRPHKEKSQPE